MKLTNLNKEQHSINYLGCDVEYFRDYMEKKMINGMTFENIHIDHIKPKDLGGEATLENGQVLCGPHNFLKKNFKQTETGKKMFINLYNLAKKEDNVELIKFCFEILEVFEKNEVNGHIEWIR